MIKYVLKNYHKVTLVRCLSALASIVFLGFSKQGENFKVHDAIITLVDIAEIKGARVGEG